MTEFLTVFFAMLTASLVVREIDAYKSARERHRDYCHKKSQCYTWMYRIELLAGRDPQQYKEQATWWEGQSKSWIPTSPTQSEQDMLLEQSQEDQIRQLIADFNSRNEESWQVRGKLECNTKSATAQRRSIA
jgi:hypothetical protein